MHRVKSRQPVAPPSPTLSIDAPGVIDVLLNDHTQGLWELARRFGKPVSERTLADASARSTADVSRSLMALEQLGLMRRVRADRRLPRGGWKCVGDRLLVVFDRNLPAHQALAKRMIDAWNQRSAAFLRSPTEPAGGRWEKRAFTLEHLDGTDLEELQSIGRALDAFMARVGTKYDGRATASPGLANYFISLHVVPITVPVPLPARVSLVSKERLAGKVAEGKSRATSALTPRERDVARLLAAGHTRQRIAEQLGITEATVRTLATRCYRKLGVSGRRELAVRLVGLAR